MNDNMRKFRFVNKHQVHFRIMVGLSLNMLNKEVSTMMNMKVNTYIWPQTHTRSVGCAYYLAALYNLYLHSVVKGVVEHQQLTFCYGGVE